MDNICDRCGEPMDMKQTLDKLGTMHVACKGDAAWNCSRKHLAEDSDETEVAVEKYWPDEIAVLAHRVRRYGNVRFMDGSLSVPTPMVTAGEIKELADWCDGTSAVRIEEAVTAFLKRKGIRVVTDAQTDALADDVEKGDDG